MRVQVDGARYDAPATLVPTYAVLPEPDPREAAVPLSFPLVVTGGGSLQPTPAQVELSHVAAHAVRHLADLAARDPVVRSVAEKEPQLWEAVAGAAASAVHQHG